MWTLNNDITRYTLIINGLRYILVTIIMILVAYLPGYNQSYQVTLDGEIFYQDVFEYEAPMDSFAMAAKMWLGKQRVEEEPILDLVRDSTIRFSMETYQNLNMTAKTRKGHEKSAETFTRIWYKLRIYIKENKCKIMVTEFRTGRHGARSLAERLIFPENGDVYRYDWLATIEDLKNNLFKRFEADVKSKSVIMRSEWDF